MTVTREERKREETWNLESFFASQEAWEGELKQAQVEAETGWKSISSLKEKLKEGDPSTIKKLLDNYFHHCRLLEKIYTFAHLRHDQDVANDLFKSGFEKSALLFHLFGDAVSWVEPTILQMPDKELKKMMESPELKGYRFYLQTLLDRKAYVLDEVQEKILALAGQPQRTASSAFKALTNADMKFPPVKDSQGKEHVLTLGSYSVLLKNQDRTLRQNAFNETHGMFKQFENTLVELISGQVQNHLFTKKARGYDSCLQAALQKFQIPVSVYKNLISATRSGLNALHDYVKLRKKVLGVDQLHFWDLSVPMVKNVEMKFSYDEACKITTQSVSLLGKEYQEILERGLTQDRWVDVYENKGKRSGAYSSGCYDSMPYILLNYQGMLNDLMTLSHEAGHSMNTLLSNRKQPYHESSYPIFIAEVASTFHEQLTAEYLVDRAKSKEERLYLLNHEIDSIRNTFFRQTMFAEFELAIHEIADRGEPLTKDLLKKLYADLNRDYFGPALVVDEHLPYEFMRIPHFYYNFYVYQYATGIAAATALVQSVKERGNKAYLEFLASGGSDYPIPILKKAGVDMASPQPIDHLLKRFHDLVKKLEKEIV